MQIGKFKLGRHREVGSEGVAVTEKSVNELADRNEE